MSRLVYLAPCAFVLAACAGSSTTNGVSPVIVAADKTRRAGSEQVAVTATVSLAGGKSLTVQGTGAFDERTGRGDLHSTVAGANGVSTKLAEVFDGNRIWLDSPLFANFFSPGTTWLELDIDTTAKKVGFDFKAFTGEDPADVLTLLESTSKTVTKVGTQSVGGVETTHYRAAIDAAQLSPDDPVERLTGARYEPVDAWVDTRGLLRKVQLDYTAKTDPAKSATAHVVLDMIFSNYGAKVNAPLPAASETDVVGAP